MGFASATGAGVQAYGQYQESKQSAGAMELNADIDRQQAKIIKTKGKLEVGRLKKRKETFSAEQQALYAKSGVAFTGSVLEVMEDSMAEAELDILMTEFNTFSEALRLESGAIQREAMAKQTKIAGRYAAFQTMTPTLLSAIPTKKTSITRTPKTRATSSSRKFSGSKTAYA